MSARVYLLISIAAASNFLLISCNFEQTCSDFPQKLSDADFPGPSLIDVNKSPKPISVALDQINFCYPQTDYTMDNKKIELESVKIGSDGFYYVFYEPRGTLDYTIVFQIREDGRVLHAFDYSMLSRFEVPRGKSK